MPTDTQLLFSLTFLWTKQWDIISEYHVYLRVRILLTKVVINKINVNK